MSSTKYRKRDGYLQKRKEKILRQEKNAREKYGGLGRCPLPCGKVKFTSRKSAKLAARAMRSAGTWQTVPMHIYSCLLDGQFFHLSSADAAHVEAVREQTARRKGYANGED